MDKMKNYLCMEGGFGEDSYAANCHLQNYTFHTFAKPHLSHALDHFTHLFFLRCVQNHITDSHVRAPSSCERVENVQSAHLGDCDNGQLRCADFVRLTVADFGCSYGRNTLDYAAFIMQGLHKRLKGEVAPYKAYADAPPLQVEMQYFFSDLPSNDFNALLQSLEPFLQEQLHRFSENSSALLKWKLFTAAVAGSFHDRLFPTGSLHVAVSAYSVQWLSQVPCEVIDRSSPAWNGGYIWIHGTRPKVVEAYARQFQKDIISFLHNRAEELAKGGILFLFFPCRDQKYPKGAFLTPQHDIWTGCYQSTWEEMVLEGLITEEERDMFNLPIYACHKTEMLEALEEFSGLFKLVQMEVLKDCSNCPKEEEEKLKEDPQLFGKFVANFVASLYKPILEDYLGRPRASMLLERLEIEATKKAHLSTCISYDMLFATIERL